MLEKYALYHQLFLDAVSDSGFYRLRRLRLESGALGGDIFGASKPANQPGMMLGALGLLRCHENVLFQQFFIGRIQLHVGITRVRVLVDQIDLHPQVMLRQYLVFVTVL